MFSLKAHIFKTCDNKKKTTISKTCSVEITLEEKEAIGVCALTIHTKKSLDMSLVAIKLVITAIIIKCSVIISYQYLAYRMQLSVYIYHW